MKRLTATCIAVATASLLQCFAAESLITMNVTGASASRVLLNYRELSGLVLVTASNVKRADHTPVTVEVSHTKALERAEAAKPIERALSRPVSLSLGSTTSERQSPTMTRFHCGELN